MICFFCLLKDSITKISLKTANDHRFRAYFAIYHIDLSLRLYLSSRIVTSAKLFISHRLPKQKITLSK